jgi:hypothetical protein
VGCRRLCDRALRAARVRAGDGSKACKARVGDRFEMLTDTARNFGDFFSGRRIQGGIVAMCGIPKNGSSPIGAVRC